MVIRPSAGALRAGAVVAAGGVSPAAGGGSRSDDRWMNITARTMLAIAPTTWATIRPMKEIQALRTLSFFFLRGRPSGGGRPAGAGAGRAGSGAGAGASSISAIRTIIALADRPRPPARDERVESAAGAGQGYFETTRPFSTPSTCDTSRARNPATVLSDSVSTTPIKVVRPRFTMMWIG